MLLFTFSYRLEKHNFDQLHECSRCWFITSFSVFKLLFCSVRNVTNCGRREHATGHTQLSFHAATWHL
jgi:hypothetical protein